MTTHTRQGCCLFRLLNFIIVILVLAILIAVGLNLVLDEETRASFRPIAESALLQFLTWAESMEPEVADVAASLGVRFPVPAPAPSCNCNLTQNIASAQASDSSSVEVRAGTCIQPPPCVQQPQITSFELTTWARNNQRKYNKLKAKGEIYSNVLDISPDDRTWQPAVQASFHLIKQAPYDNFEVKIFQWRDAVDDWVIVSHATAYKKDDWFAHGEIQHTSLYALVDTQPQPQLVSVPDVTSLDIAVATGRLVDADLAVGQIDEVESNESPGTVLQQSRPGGAEVPSGTTVNLVISTGYSPPSPVIISLPQNQAITQGECAVLTWHVQNAKVVYLNGERVNNQDSWEPCPYDTTTYRLDVYWLDGSENVYEATITVNPPPDPVILVLPQNQTITEGECVTLSWHVQNIREIYFDGEGVGGQDSRQRCPTQTRTYPLEIVRLDGYSEFYETTVSVNPLPKPSVSFHAEYTTIVEGKCTTLFWDVQYAQVVYLDGDVVSGQGAQDVCPSITTIYWLDVISLRGNETSYSVTVSVEPPAAVVLYDFVATANSAQWDNDYRTPGLPFPGSVSDDRGFVLWQYNARLEDGSQPYQVLETHPEWIDNGLIRGTYDLSGLVLQTGDRFVGRVGFLDGADAGDVTFKVEISYNVPGVEFCCSVEQTLYDNYDGRVEDWEFPVPREVIGYKLYSVELQVEAGTTSAQDWAVWEIARLERP